MDVDVRAVDGSAVGISLGAGQGDLLPWTSRTRLKWAGRGVHEIIAGVRQFPASVASLAGVALTEQTTVGSWTVLYGSGQQYDDEEVFIGHLTIAAILGESYGCLLHVYNANIAVLLELVALLAIDESSNGIAVESRSHSLHVDTGETSVIQSVSNIGVLEVRPLTPAQLRAAPFEDGMPTDAGGELFSANVGTMNPNYKVLDRSAVTVISPSSIGPDDDAYIRSLRSVHAEWNELASSRVS
ncbi:MAG: hypothetical protein F4Z00_04725 [Acidimicrobiaceae bacterium]|nr:hypothetical protein [Acidimicrobiaceae bacterium]MXZ64838.1 hypothetical protein [Acidimicrobiaceae bacterium]MYF33059.1 hypothetical protein [Acidimicrobiaceae bacterium]MYG78285.1 hypothetical protein [Acidimicrobiaceae bacterium]MYJ84063.1 hypothetical protein [Acidimicrobiaceae bacterium]